MKQRRRYSIVVVGAGPVGLATANLLARSRMSEQLDIVMIDAGVAPAWDEREVDLRVYALSRASEWILRKAGAWQDVERRRISPYTRMRVWEGESFAGAASLEFDSADLGEPNLGFIAEDSLLRDALRVALSPLDNVEVRNDATVETLTPRADRIELGLSTGQSLTASLVIAADGARSKLRELASLRVLSRDYEQRAIVTHVRSERPHARTAWQRFLPGGPLAFLPLADGRSSVVWSLPSDEAQRLAHAAEDVFAAELQHSSGSVLGELTMTAPRAALPLRAQHAMRYCAARMALVGDAAHAVHPLAGQGANLGLRDAAAIADAVGRAVELGQDPGDQRVLQRYERDRKGDNLSMLLALDAIDRLFRLPGTYAPLRRAGLGLVDRLPFVKRELMSRALGTAYAASLAIDSGARLRSAP
jgi:2-octaprenylphenol hydroxylase